jgi:hypothetical protein
LVEHEPALGAPDQAGARSGEQPGQLHAVWQRRRLRESRVDAVFDLGGLQATAVEQRGAGLFHRLVG